MLYFKNKLKNIILIISILSLFTNPINAQQIEQPQKEIKSPPMVIMAQAPVYTLGDVFYSRAGHAERDFKNGSASFKNVVEIYQLATQYGKNEAYIGLAKFYEANNDTSNALENYKKAADLNIFGANYLAASLIHKSNPNNCVDALPYLEKALIEKSYMSETTAAKWYVEKTCGANDDKKAFEYAEKVTNLVSYSHINFIARAYYEGIGTQKNLPKAWAYLIIASNMNKSETSWVNHDPQYAIDTLKILEPELKAKPSEFAKAKTELDELCNANYICPIKLLNKLKDDGRTQTRPAPFAPYPAPPRPNIRAPAPEGYIRFESMEFSNPNKYSELRELYSIARDFEREYLKTNQNKPDINILIEKYLIPAEAGHAHAMYRLSGLYQELRNNAKMREWLKKSADAGNNAAQLKYGQLSLDPLNCDDAIKYLTYAQYDLSVPANIDLGALYGSDKCGPPDYVKAFNANARAAKFSNIPAQIALADAFYYAKGTKQNLNMAIAWGKIAWYNSPVKGIFANPNPKEVFERAKKLEKDLSGTNYDLVRNTINEVCLFQTTCKNISNEDLIKMQKQEE